MGNPGCTGKRWRKEERALVAEFREQGGSRGQWQEEAAEVGMMLETLRPLEFMVGGCNHRLLR